MIVRWGSMVPPRLIVVRGPSGSGKSTVACRLFEGAVRRVCLIEQDHYRFIFRPAGGGSLPNSATIHRMIEHNVMAALIDGYDVILEGILSVRSYGLVLDRLFSAGGVRELPVLVRHQHRRNASSTSHSTHD